MKIQEIILRAMSGEITWIKAAMIIGISDRSMRRWKDKGLNLRLIHEQSIFSYFDISYDFLSLFLNF
jgi:hypothetical protein